MAIKVKGLYTQTEVARQLAMSVSLFNYWVTKGFIPAPRARRAVGRRFYYTYEEMQHIIELVEQARKV